MILLPISIGAAARTEPTAGPKHDGASAVFRFIQYMLAKDEYTQTPFESGVRVTPLIIHVLTNRRCSGRGFVG